MLTVFSIEGLCGEVSQGRLGTYRCQTLQRVQVNVI